jgi:hypothetical protein
MYMRRTKGAKRDPVRQWELPERVFFACGACHVLAYAFLRNYPQSGSSLFGSGRQLATPATILYCRCP